MTTFNFREGGKVEHNRVFGGGNFKMVIEFDTTELAEQAREAMQSVVDVGEEAATRRVPVQTGRLQGTIRGFVRREGGEIQGILRVGGPGGRQAPYWAFVEYGTGIRGAATSPHVQSDDTSIKAQGYRHDHQGAQWKGMRARPYMRPALDDMAAFFGRG